MGALKGEGGLEFSFVLCNTITSEAKCCINFNEQENEFVSVHHNESYIYLFVNGIKNLSIQNKRFWIKCVSTVFE